MGVMSVKGQLTDEQRASLKTAQRIEQYKISGTVILLPARRFVPIDSIEKLQVRLGHLPSKGCCGMSFPVYNAVLFFRGAPPAKLMFEKKENAQHFCKLITSAHADIVLEEYEMPYSQEAD